MNLHPQIDDAPGLGWRQRAEGWVAYWIARPDLVKRGYRPKTQRLWPQTDAPHPGEPTDDNKKYIRGECRRLQDEMLGWAREGNKARIEVVDTIHDLIDAYKDDVDSPYQPLRFDSKRVYDANLRTLDHDVGARVLAKVTGRDFRRWYNRWARDGAQPDRGHALITMIRIMVSFGVGILENAECIRLAVVLEHQEFAKGRPRTAELTAEMATAVRAAGHEVGRPSISLGQALQFDLILRPKDVVGEWLPMEEPGMSDITCRDRKWLYGLDWREVSPDLILTHRISKSLRGRGAIANSRAGKTKVFDLKLYPMVMAEIALIPPERRVGPMIVNEQTGLPYWRSAYGRVWRQVANVAGIPKEIQNRDSRAGGITEGEEAMDGNLEPVRHAAGHSRLETTQIYSRGEQRNTAKVAVLRAERRKP